MTTDLQTLRGTLQARAEGVTDVGDLLARIGPAYRRRRSRRIVGATATALAVGGLLALLVTRLPATGHALPATPAISNLAPNASAIGSDPQTVHFDVGRFPYPVSSTTWSVRDGVEQVSLWGSMDQDSKYFAELTLTPSTVTVTPDATVPPQGPRQPHSAPATVGGQPALVVTDADPDAFPKVTRVSWPPITGVHAELVVRGPMPVSRLVEFAGTLRLDTGHQCVLRVHPTVLPPGARITGCSAIADTGGGQLIIGGPNGTITIGASATPIDEAGASPRATGGPPPRLGTLTNGWTYQEFDVSRNTQHWTSSIRIFNPYTDLWSQGAYGLPDLLLVANGLQQ